MNIGFRDSLLKQINSLLKFAENMRFYSSKDRIQDRDLQQLLSMSESIINRLGSADTTHSKHAREWIDSDAAESYKLDRLLGVISSLKLSVESGYLDNIEELIHGELFDNFIDMAEHLLNEGYKDASAVIVGSSLESHLRNLCIRNSIETTIRSANNERPKKADQMNSELASSGVYEKLDLKSVTAWLDLRNKAAHGEYDKYSNDQVRLMITGVRYFIARYPA